MAAAIAAKKQQSTDALLKKLTSAKAFGPTSAIPLTPDTPEQEQALAELIGTATVRLWNGNLYLDRDRQKAQAQQGGWIALVVLVALVSLGASLVALLSL